MSEKMPKSMTLERFYAIIDAYGTRPLQWPEEERDAALALLQHAEQAQAYALEAEPLDALLSTDNETASAALTESILAQAADMLVVQQDVADQVQPQKTVTSLFHQLFGDIDRLEWSFARLATPMMVLLMAGFLGMATGIYTTEDSDLYAYSDEDVLLLALQVPDFGFDDTDTF